MSPFELEFLLHCYYSPSPFPKVENDIIKDFARKMEGEGVIRRNMLEADIWAMTEKGRAWIQHILETPMPVMTWVRGGVSK